MATDVTAEREANARLIAAAPDMLATLQEIAEWDEVDPSAVWAIELARAAVARAVG